MAYLVTAPLVIVRDDEGMMHHVYQGAPLPQNALAEDVDRFLEEGFISETEAPEPAPEESEPVDGAPKGNASREEWAAYAKKKGAPDEQTRPVEEGGLKQTELRELYG